MYLQLKNDVVRKNVEIFKIILKRAVEIQENAPLDKVGQTFNAFIHKDRGEIRFSSLHTTPLDSREWVSISFNFSLSASKEESFFLSVRDLPEAQLQTEALQTLQETLKTIQFISKFLPRLQTLSAVLREFSHTNLDAFLDQLSTKDLIHEAWHPLDRIGCEHFLSEHAPGSFLFRKDSFANMLQEQLSLAHQEPILCVTLTYVAHLQQLNDLTLVQKATGWLVYNNDPSLEGPLYPSIQALLGSLRDRLRSPVLHS